MQKLEVFLQQTSGSCHIICGDFNGWHSFWGSSSNNKRGTAVADLIFNNNLSIGNTGNSPTFETITHRKLRHSIIDLSLVSKSNITSISEWAVHTEICPSSDHNAIRFNLSLDSTQFSKNCKLSTFRYNTLQVKWNLIEENFNSEVRSRLPPNADIQNLNADELENYIDQITMAIQKSCDKLLPRASGACKRAPWWTDQLEELKQKVIACHHTLRNLKRRKLPMEQALEERDKILKEYSDAICATSTSNFKEFCTKQKKEDVWSVTNRIIKTKPLTQPPATLKCEDGSYTKGCKETAQVLLNKFYPDDTPDTTDSQFRMRNSICGYTGEDASVEPPFTICEITECLKSMNHKKAPGPDHLTSDICLQFAKSFPDVITGVMNRCFSLEYFPKSWKIAFSKIIPKPSCTNFSDPSSFRPIGLINVFGKLLEKLIMNRLTHYMNINGKSSEKQYGFKQQTSTVTAIHGALDIIKEAKSRGEHAIAVSLDIKSAFNNAWWPAIFHRLRKINCPPNLYNILMSYINNRKVYMKFADCKVSKEMSRGCIQGSVCGPTLWNLILDELLSTSLPMGCHMQAYADDVLLVCHAKNISELEMNTNIALKIITQWGEGVKLEFGPAKTQVIGFTNKSQKCQIIVHGQSVKFVNQIKYLGVIIDRKLNFIKHTEYILNKAKHLFNKLSIFVRPTWGVHPENIKTIYLQVIEPIICYASSVWTKALSYEYVKKRLLSLQRLFAIKIIQGFRTVSTAAAITLAQLTPLPDKVMEIADIEISKLCGCTRFLPLDTHIELPATPSQHLHPANRVPIEFKEVNSLSELDNLDLNEYSQFYTDGSRHDDRVGSALVIIDTSNKQTVKKYKLHDCCSVFQAELLAILKAIEHIVMSNIKKSAILSDSKSGLQELANPNSTNNLVVSIRHHLFTAQLNHQDIKFIWIKAHNGIPGNEMADTAAKAAAFLHRRPDYDLIPISYIKKKNKEISKEAQEKLYNNPNTCKYTKTLLPSHENVKKYLSIVKPRFAVTQFLTNHGFHKEYLFRFKITQDNLCPCDGSSIQSMTHLIEKCPRFENTRYNHLMTANLYNIQPYNLSEIISREKTIDTYHFHIYTIIKNLKKFNNT
ncbi:hypothetical protein O0L34_g19024 [Tuta absoluta]|nr:hypothetical protein O0L34_g19024 [Tuta absoluta]